MGLNVGELSVQLGIDKDKYDRGLGEATRDADRAGDKIGRDLGGGIGGGLEGSSGGIGSKFGGIMSSIGPMAVVAGGAAGLAAGIAFGEQMFSRGNELSALSAKVDAVFGDSSASVREWADANNEALGMSKEALAGTAAATGDLLKPLGFTTDQAAAMSTQITGLSGALSAWSGGTKSAAEVSEILNSAMLGEYDAAKSLGIALSGDEVTARTKQIQDATGATEGQAQALAVQQLVMEKSADAQKAWTDGSMDGIKNTNTLKATAQQLTDSLATKLAPAFQTVTAWIVDTLIPAIERWVNDPATKAWFADVARIAGEVVAWFQANWPMIAAIIKEVVDLNVGAFRVLWGAVAGIIDVFSWLVAKIGEVATWVGSTLVPAIMSIAERIGAVATWVGVKVGEIISFVTGIPGRIAAVVSTLWNGISSGISAAREWVGTEVGNVVSAITGIPGRIGSLAETLREAGKDLIRGMINGVGDMASALTDKVKNIVGGAVDGVKNLLGIKSPSRVFMKMGHQTIEGYSLGVEQQGRQALSSMSNVMSGLGGAALSSLANVGAPGSGAAAAAAGGSSVPVRSGASVTVNAETNADPHAIAAKVAWGLVGAGRS